MADKSRDLRKQIEAYFISNPTASKTDCSRALNISFMTVKRHVTAILKRQERVENA
jgi:predicted ArsR family transcriptional regulator